MHSGNQQSWETKGDEKWGDIRPTKIKHISSCIYIYIYICKNIYGIYKHIYHIYIYTYWLIYNCDILYKWYECAWEKYNALHHTSSPQPLERIPRSQTAGFSLHRRPDEKNLSGLSKCAISLKCHMYIFIYLYIYIFIYSYKCMNVCKDNEDNIPLYSSWVLRLKNRNIKYLKHIEIYCRHLKFKVSANHRTVRVAMFMSNGTAHSQQSFQQTDGKKASDHPKSRGESENQNP